jgi:tetratricopeptide (TPR) repeat protein
MATELVCDGEHAAAIDLLAAVRPWIGSTKLPLSLLGPVSTLLMQDSCSTCERWGEAVATLGAAYFHASEFDKMLCLLKAATSSEGFNTLDTDLRIQLQMQYGLAKRALGDLDEAARTYKAAIKSKDSTVSNGTIVKCYYNLGTIYEHQERLEESLAAHEAAADHFGQDTDPRVENLVNTAIGRLRYRLGGDLVSACFILEATLAHARERQDYRSMGETLQNLGLVAYERGLYLRSALAESIGSMFLLDFGYTTHFRDLAKSSFVTLCACMLELEAAGLAATARTLIDRLGDADLYPPNKVIFEKVMAKTYRQPSLRFRMAHEGEVREFLRRSCLWAANRSLDARENLDLIVLIEGSDRLSPDRLDLPGISTSPLEA